MKKIFTYTGIVLLVLIFALVGYVVFLQIFPRVANETRDSLPETTSPEQSQTSNPPILEAPAPKPVDPSGSFVGLGVHQASGKVTLIKTNEGNFIRLEDDFSVTNGPDLYVYVGDNNSHSQEVAVLKATKGGQNYKLPEGVDPASFDTVWIYCKRFSTPFAKAKLSS